MHCPCCSVQEILRHVTACRLQDYASVSEGIRRVGTVDGVIVTKLQERQLITALHTQGIDNVLVSDWSRNGSTSREIQLKRIIANVAACFNPNHERR